MPVPYKTILILKTLHTNIYIYEIALISPCRRGQVDGRFYACFGWDFIFFASLLEIVNGHEIQIKYVVVKYPKGTSKYPS